MPLPSIPTPSTGIEGLQRLAGELRLRREAVAKVLEVLDGEIKAVDTTIRLIRERHLGTTEQKHDEGEA